MWAVLLGAVAVGAAKAPAASGGGASFMPGIEAQQAFDLIGQRFPGSDADGATARIVFVAPRGERVTSSGHRAAIDTLVPEAAGEPQVSGAVSKDGSTACATVDSKVKADALTTSDKAALEQAIGQARGSGLTVQAGGTALPSKTAAGGSSEVIGIGLAAIVLLITFGSFAAAGLALLAAVVGVGVGMAAILALGHALALPRGTGRRARFGRRRGTRRGYGGLGCGLHGADRGHRAGRAARPVAQRAPGRVPVRHRRPRGPRGARALPGQGLRRDGRRRLFVPGLVNPDTVAEPGRRVSVGTALAQTAYGAMRRAVAELLDSGTCAAMERAVDSGTVNSAVTAARTRRGPYL
ncbi:hypothetical protein BIV23_44380 [Streptomyces monashensis]|uniref:Membrane transport protein MMPL domain-containing protein n=1 Tax=Streptomyces monashensis TaxID=1678012 RepID=A0A1S2NW61_9ACTN|nr:hypothetical protein BIV23_44380 [Streptomyces monashensis]